ncbi:MAG: hypothetical protein ACRDOJ_07425 [Nocardioidaceae bacterium]
MVGVVAFEYGIDISGRWWAGTGDLMPVLLGVVLLAVMPIAVVLEVRAVVAGRRAWPAKAVVVGYVLVAGFVSHLPLGVRFLGDTGPESLSNVSLALVGYALLVVPQCAVAFVLCIVTQAHARSRVRRGRTGGGR